MRRDESHSINSPVGTKTFGQGRLDQLLPEGLAREEGSQGLDLPQWAAELVRHHWWALSLG